MKPKLVIWGASGHAMVVAGIIRLRDEYELLGFVDDVNPERQGSEFCNAKILGGMDCLERFHEQGIHSLILGFGNNLARLRLSSIVVNAGYQLVSAIHPKAVVAASAVIGKGTVINAGAVIDPDVQIGENVLIGACVTVGHGCRLWNASRIGGGGNLAGRVTIGEATWVGTGVVVKDRIRIGQRTLIGAGAVVVRDIPDGVVAYGNPARVMRIATEKDY
jgi:UDP-N-acetylbacillosamine N-acetyltransferase